MIVEQVYFLIHLMNSTQTRVLLAAVIPFPAEAEVFWPSPLQLSAPC